jgi:hypothetical protein
MKRKPHYGVFDLNPKDFGSPIPVRGVLLGLMRATPSKWRVLTLRKPFQHMIQHMIDNFSRIVFYIMPYDISTASFLTPEERSLLLSKSEEDLMEFAAFK